MPQAEVNLNLTRELNINFQDLLKLTNTCFNSINYTNNFPQVFKESMAEFLFLLKSDNIPVAFCSLYPLSFSLEGKTRVRAYCIGSVCSHPNYRNQGIAAKTILLAEKKAKEELADFIFLFADNNKLYSKLGFTSCGQTYLAPISKEKSNKIQYKNYLSINNFLRKNLNLNEIKYFTYKNLTQLSENIKAKVWRFIIQYSHSSEAVLGFLEFKDLLKINNMQLIISELDGNIIAISFLNKGDDFQNVIHANYFTKPKYLIAQIEYIFKFNNENDLFFFPGVFYKEFKNFFNYISIPLMSIKSLNEKKFPSKSLNNLCSSYRFFVNSLQGT